MKYYRVKPEFDNCKADKHYNIFVGNELLTEKEAEKALPKFINRNNCGYGAIMCKPETKESFYRMFDVVDVPKNRTYWMFGARFAE